MANMTFKANLLPNSDLGYSLGSSNKKWNVYGNLTGNAATATKLATARTISLTGSVTGSGSFDGSGNLSISTSTNHTHGNLVWRANFAKGSNPTSATWPFGSWAYGSGSGTAATDRLLGFEGLINTDGSTGIYLRAYQNASGSSTAHTFGINAGKDGSCSYTISAPDKFRSAISAAAASHTHNYLPLSGGTLSGFICVNTTNSTEAQVKAQSNAGMIYLYSQGSTTGFRGIYGINASGTYQSMFGQDQDGKIQAGGALYGAVWNDYAEMRNVPEANNTYDNTTKRKIKLAGRCVHEVGNDTMVLSTERMQPGCKIISDTFGFNIGETDDCKTPIAVSGRALVYIYEGRDAAASHVGQPVCSGPDGTVSIMTDEEYAKKGYCCVGTISAVPEYEVWGTGNIKVDGRIWIYVR